MLDKNLLNSSRFFSTLDRGFCYIHFLMVIFVSQTQAVNVLNVKIGEKVEPATQHDV